MKQSDKVRKMCDEPKDMTDKELAEEYEEAVWRIDNSSFGTKDVMWLDQLEREVIRRDLTIEKKVKVK